MTGRVEASYGLSMTGMLFLLLACGEVAPLDPPPPPPPPMPKIAEPSDDLRRLFGEDSYELARLHDRFLKVITVYDFKTALSMTLKLAPKLENRLRELKKAGKDTDLQPVADQIVGMVLVTRADGTSSLVLSVGPWAEAAGHTSDRQDDLYVQLSDAAYGNAGMQGPATWEDVDGTGTPCSRLTTEVAEKFSKQADAAIHAGVALDKRLSVFKDALGTASGVNDCP